MAVVLGYVRNFNICPAVWQTVCFFLILSGINLGLQCNVLDYGAVGDGHTDDTLSIQKAFDFCNKNNNEWNIVLFPKDYNFYTYSISFNYSNLEIIINSIITMPANMKNWPIWNVTENGAKGNRVQPWLTNLHFGISNILIHGTGLINGNGKIWWDAKLNGTLPKTGRPFIINLQNITNVTIYDITLINSPSCYIFINYCVDVIVHNINITGPPYNIAPETDGLDLGSRNVYVYDSYIENGDDSYEIKWWAKNITIENSIAVGGLGLDVGTTALPIIQNVTFKNMICKNTWWGIRLKQQSFMNGTVMGLKFINITFDNVQRGIDINDYNQTVQSSVSNGNNMDLKYVNVTDIMFEDIYGSYTIWAGQLDCDVSVPCTHLQFRNINLKYNGNSTDQGFSCSDGVHGTAVNVTPPIDCLLPNM
eukprot:171219_1